MHRSKLDIGGADAEAGQSAQVQALLVRQAWVEHLWAQAPDRLHTDRCMPHRRAVLHWSNMSRNQSRTMGSTWILRRFVPLPLGSSSMSAAAGAAQGVLV